MDILHRFTGVVVFSIEGNSLQEADLRGANLQGANLRGANLLGANLQGEILKSAPVIMSGLAWNVLITNAFMTIGCQRHRHEEWFNFDEHQISSMHSGALEFWNKTKVSLLEMCAAQRG